MQAAADLGGLGALGTAGSALLFASVRKQLICIDDLERVGDGLAIRDVMGYISFMKEERFCKIVLLLNDSQLTTQSAEQFTRDFEKVVDQSVLLAPQPSEVAQIVLGKEDSILAVRVAQLGITNFRVITKIARALKLCEPVLSQFDGEVSEHAATAMSVLGWSLYRAEGSAPISFLRGLASSRRLQMQSDILGKEPPTQSEEEKRWRSILDTYRFGYMDAFDEALLRVMEQGYCDPVTLRPAAEAKYQEILKKRGQVSLKKAWALYHASFEDNLADVIQSFKDALREYTGSLEAGDVFQVAQLFWELRLEKDAKDVISGYHGALRGDNSAGYSDELLDRYIKSPGLQEHILTTLGDGKTPLPEDVLSMFRQLESGSWSDDHIAKLGAFPTEDFVMAFRSFRGQELTDIGRACLQWRNVSNPTEGMVAVQSKTEAALKLLGEESPLNNNRLTKFGLRSTSI